MADLGDDDKKLLADIKEYGWHVVLVSEDEEGPGFGFSVGLFKTFGHPEILIIGLQLDMIQVLINNIGYDIKNGKKFRDKELEDDILEGYNCMMLDVPKKYYKEYLGYAKWFYKEDDFPVLQCIYPDRNGVFPWQKNFSEKAKGIAIVLAETKDLI